jgi:hypothetical protein
MAMAVEPVSAARRRIAMTARVAAAAVIIVAASGKLPHLVLTQAVVSLLLSMVIAPLWLLDPGDGRWVARVRRITPFVGVLLISTGTIALQAPAVVGPLSAGGPLSAAALVAFLAGSIAFWTMIMPPHPPISGLGAAGYVIMGGVPISMPAMLLILMPRDAYAGFHASTGSTLLDGRTDQLLSGFLLFAVVKIAIFGMATILFFRAAHEVPEDGDDDDGGHRGRLPVVPGWLRQLGRERLPQEPAITPANPAAASQPAPREPVEV